MSRKTAISLLLSLDNFFVSNHGKISAEFKMGHANTLLFHYLICLTSLKVISIVTFRVIRKIVQQKNISYETHVTLRDVKAIRKLTLNENTKEARTSFQTRITLGMTTIKFYQHL